MCVCVCVPSPVPSLPLAYALLLVPKQQPPPSFSLSAEGQFRIIVIKLGFGSPLSGSATYQLCYFGDMFPRPVFSPENGRLNIVAAPLGMVPGTEEVTPKRGSSSLRHFSPTFLSPSPCTGLGRVKGSLLLSSVHLPVQLGDRISQRWLWIASQPRGPQCPCSMRPPGASVIHEVHWSEAKSPQRP